MKQRLDRVIVARGLATSRERAASLILAGRILVNEQKVTKAGCAIEEDAAIRMLGEVMPYVSRGGVKLAGALDHWGISLQDRMCVDIGASTGGFTDCMLQRGARAVVAVDTGYGQMAMKLRTDTRVRLLERTNARHLEASALLIAARDLIAAREVKPAATIDFFCMDVSFISASLVLPAVVGSMSIPGQSWVGECVVLVKPQFEAGKEWVGKGGIVRDPAAHTLAIDKVKRALIDLGGSGIGATESPITGMEGNREFLLHAFFS